MVTRAVSDPPATAELRRAAHRECTALLLDGVPPTAAATLTEAGIKVRTAGSALSERELIEAAADVEILGVRSETQLSDTFFDHAQRLTAVGAFCVGTHQIDLDAATRHGVAVFDAPFSSARSVVEMVLAEIIALSRRLTVKSSTMHAGVWDKSAAGAHEVRGRRLGIVGYGQIGSQLSVLAEALGMRVFFYDVVDRLAVGNARRCGSLQELLSHVDVVSVHVDGRPENAGLFGEAEFTMMNPGSLFLNVSHGFVADHEALRASIMSGRLAGAAVDVFAEEPMRPEQSFESPLSGLANVILTPHIGGATEEAQEDIGQFVSGKLVDFVTTGATTLSLNLPSVSLEKSRGTQRLAYLHHNVPGVLARINALLAERDVNVEAQALASRGDLGLLLADIGQDDTAAVADVIAELPQTIALRVIDSSNCEGA